MSGPRPAALSCPHCRRAVASLELLAPALPGAAPRYSRPTTTDEPVTAAGLAGMAESAAARAARDPVDVDALRAELGPPPAHA